MHPISVRLGFFFTFFEKKDGKCTQMLYFWVLIKKVNWEKKILTNGPKYSEIPLEGNWLATIFFFWPNLENGHMT